MQSNHRLFIYNVTVDDLRLYYCVTKDVPPKYSNGGRLHFFGEFSDHVITLHTFYIKNLCKTLQWFWFNHRTDSRDPKSESNTMDDSYPIVGLLNGVLIIVMRSLIKLHLLLLC